ncbi:hypothetical protein ACFQMM_02605 [Saliphagus sp. GCM10025308]
MTYTQSVDNDKAHCVWTKHIPSNIVIAEYSEPDYHPHINRGDF